MIHPTATPPLVLKAAKHLLLSIGLMFASGFVLHGLYPALDGVPRLQTLLSPLLPLNESVWEHGKLALTPMIVWWSLSWSNLAKPARISGQTWITASAIALLSSFFVIPLLYYGYTGALGVESVVVDILILLVALTCGQLLAFHLIQHLPHKAPPIWIPVCVIAFLLGSVLLCTISPPSLPWWIPNS